MNDDFLSRLARFVTQNALIGHADKVAVALSGGPDSVALLLALCRCAERGLLPQKPVGVLHFHHGIRGADADADAAFCAGLAARFGLPCVIGLGVVPQKNGAYSNNDARRARYAFLEEAAREIGANVIATAHTKNDQAETVLWRVLRGTGLPGLSGIPPRRQISPGLFVVRPLLGQTREAVEAFCQSERITPRRDPTNENGQFTRVRVRRVLPRLSRDFNPRLLDALPRLAAHAARDADLLNALAENLWDDATNGETEEGDGGGVRLHLAPLRAAHPALRTRVLLRALRRATTNAPEAEEAATDAFVNVLDELLARPSGAAADLPGKIRALCCGDFLTLIPAQDAISTAILYDVPLHVPGTVDLLLPLGLHISAEWCKPEAAVPVRSRRSNTVDVACPFWVNANGTMGNDKAIAPLFVRSARPGDKFAPLGMNRKTRLVRDVLADAKIPKGERDTFPLVVRGDTGAILWIVGVAQAEETRITTETPRILRFQAVPVQAEAVED